MTVPLGETIRALRQRDGRTQEALASAIGVTSQAVSRWESNGGYPDLETIPAIANYFHVTIDALFGYTSERDTIIEDILKTADATIEAGHISNETLKAVEAATAEFPVEWPIWMRYGIMRMMLGFEGHGARSSKPDKESDGRSLASYNRENEDLTAALAVFEKILPELADSEDRATVVGHMVRLYSIRGEYEKAETLARTQAPLSVSREILLPTTAVGETRKRYQGQLLLALAWRMTNTVIAQVTLRHDLRSSHIGIDKALQMAELYHSICDDGNYGFGHFALQQLYHLCSRIACEQGLHQEALLYARQWRDHHHAYEIIKAAGGTFPYSAPLVQGVTESVDKMPPIRPWPETVARQNAALRQLLVSNPSLNQ